MIRLGRFFLLIMMLFLIGSALNISNSAINQLTMQNRAAIIGADYNNDRVCVFLFGQSYDYEMDKFQATAKFAESKTHELVNIVVQHFIKCYRIFRAVFL